MKNSITALSIAALALVAGCAAPIPDAEPFVIETQRSTLMEKNSQTASIFANHLKSENLDDKPLLVTSVARVSDLESSSTFGRAISEQLSGRLATLGIKVVEPRVRKTLSINHSGEFLLSRDAKDLTGKAAVKVVLTGSYSHGKEVVTVHLKLIDATEKRVLLGHSYVIPTKEFDAMTP